MAKRIERTEELGTSRPTGSKSAAPPNGGSRTDQVAAVLARARESGLTSGKTGRIAGRVSPALVERAKARTGLRSDTALIEFALATLVVEDQFPGAFKDLKSTVDPDLDLGC